MQDAFNLAWKLALIVRGIAASDALLDSYSAERSPIATQVLADSGRLTAIAMTRSRLAQQVRNFLAHQILGFAGAQQAMADRLSETSLAYKDSPLSVGSARGLNGPAPGQRIRRWCCIRSWRHASLRAHGRAREAARVASPVFLLSLKAASERPSTKWHLARQARRLCCGRLPRRRLGSRRRVPFVDEKPASRGPAVESSSSPTTT